MVLRGARLDEQLGGQMDRLGYGGCYLSTVVHLSLPASPLFGRGFVLVVCCCSGPVTSKALKAVI